MIGIYKITNKINGKLYIGQSVRIHQRWQDHCKPSSDSLIAKEIKKYGKENFLFEVIEECDEDKLDDLENYWIKHYNTIVPNGYNVSDSTTSNKTLFIYFDKVVLENIILDLQKSFFIF